MSLVPSEDSSAATWWVTTERARPSWVATAAKLPASATRTNTFMAESLSIVANPATLKPILSTISRRRLHLLLDSAIHKEEAAMILVPGANGHLGRAIIDHLAARLEPGTPTLLAVSVRDPAKAEALARRGVEVRHGDFDRPETLAAAFAGVKRIVYTSFLDVNVDSPAEFAAVHRASEAELRTSGTELAILRNPLYADYLPMTVGGALESGVFYLSAGGGRASFLSRDELAEAAAAAAIKDRLDKNIYELTGPAVHTYHDVAAAVSRFTGKPIRYLAVPEDAYAEALAGYGVAPWMARALANMYSAVAAGHFDRFSDDYARLVGHAPRTLDQQIELFFTR